MSESAVPPDPDELTELLRRLAAGDKSVENILLARIYGELKRLAGAYLRRERPGHTLQATALVHEAYLRLTQHRDLDCKDRIHFFALAAKTMRRILTDYARQRNAAKRGGLMSLVPFEENLRVTDGQSVLIESLSEALDALAATDARLVQIVELKFFAGLTEDDIAELLGISSRTVKRDWALARAWLRGRLEK
jgi:RNA polymerase sigma-70 factor (ECF subfamily)